MELHACVEALSALERDSSAIVVRTDSLYVLKSCGLWLKGWKARVWRKHGPLLNVDLLQRLDTLQSRHRVRCEWSAGTPQSPTTDRSTASRAAKDRIARGQDPASERRLVWAPPVCSAGPRG